MTLFVRYLGSCLLLITVSGLFAQPQLRLVDVASGFVNPVDIQHAGDERLFIVEQEGRIQIADTSGNREPNPFLDITDRVNDSGFEMGLLGLAFHPDYAANGYFYVNYTDASGATTISRFERSGADPNLGDASTEQILLQVSQPYTNHNGGCLQFGPDGYLYIGLGDGGLFGDPGNRSQDPQELLGKMLRIDIDGGSPYAIPPDNPYVASVDTLDEIWQFGLRNPWKYSFDRQDPYNLWIADVGQDDWEEINVNPAAEGGQNWGWRCYEGAVPYNTLGCGPFEDYDAPVFIYDHITEGFSVTGGYVYRGSRQRHSLGGHYVFCDFVTGNFWTIRENLCDTIDALQAYPLGFISDLVTSFGEDVDGEIYLVDFLGRLRRVEDDCAQYEVPQIDPMQSDSLLAVGPSGTYQWYGTVEGCLPENDDFINPFNYAFQEIWVEITTPDDCTLRSDVFDTWVDGLDDWGLTGKPKYYPNPAIDQIRIEWQDAHQALQIQNASLCNVLGACQSVNLDQARSGQIQLENSAPGWHYLQFDWQERSRTLPLIIE